MTFEIIESPKGALSLYKPDVEATIDSASDFLDVLMSAPSQTLVVSNDHVAARFFDLSSGLAGEILQKISNYRKRLVVLGDFSQVSSKSLKDFVYESNRTGQVIFVANLEEGVRLLK